MAIRERASTTRKVFLVVVCLVVLLGPVIFLSGPGLAWIEKRSDESMQDPEGNRQSAAAWQWRVAVAYAYTFRPEKAAAAYESAYHKYRAIGDYESASRARFEQAVELEEADKRYDALEVYSAIIEEFADQEEVHKEATHARSRLKYLGRP